MILVVVLVNDYSDRSLCSLGFFDNYVQPKVSIFQISRTKQQDLVGSNRFETILKFTICTLINRILCRVSIYRLYDHTPC